MFHHKESGIVFSKRFNIPRARTDVQTPVEKKKKKKQLHENEIFIKFCAPSKSVQCVTNGNALGYLSLWRVLSEK